MCRAWNERVASGGHPCSVAGQTQHLGAAAGSWAALRLQGHEGGYWGLGDLIYYFYLSYFLFIFILFPISFFCFSI